MKTIINYIQEKLKISETSFMLEKLKITKDTKIISKIKNDPSTWNVGDIIWFTGHHIEFYKIIKRTSKQFELHNIPVKLISGYFNSYKYECVPEFEKESEYITKGRITKDSNLRIDKRTGYAELWDKNPVIGHGIF